MPSHRLTEYCNEALISPYSRGLCHSRDYGDSVFPLDGTCGKPKQVISTYELDATYTVQRLACGHYDVVPTAVHIAHSERNLTYDRLLPHQKQFVDFAESANLKVICGDQMGTGKTPQTLVLILENAAKFTNDFKGYCLIVVPTGSIYNWEEEAKKWFGLATPDSMEHLMLTPQVIVDMKQKLTPFNKIVICPWSKMSSPPIKKQLLAHGIASIVVDEAHFFKDENSQRTQSLLDYLKVIGPNGPRVFLSGTLIENRIMEIKVALHACDPQFWYSWSAVDRFCDHDSQGKALGISRYMHPQFIKVTSKYMIRRKKEDLNLPLPNIEYHVEWVNPSDWETNEDIIEGYNKTLDEMQEMIDSARPTSLMLIGYMQQLRHYVAKMKIMSAAIWIETFMMTHPGEKLAVGIHHIDVRKALAELLKARNPLQMSDEDAKEKDEIEREFRDNSGRNLLICSVLSAGVGRNFQFCRTALLLERQWNKSKENQFFERFWRIIQDSDGRVRTHFTEADTVHITTMNCSNSFDEYFDSMVHLKGYIADSSEENIEDLPDETSIKQLAELVIAKRMQYTPGGLF
jgi:SNF2 family DNA or RNA helicase